LLNSSWKYLITFITCQKGWKKTNIFFHLYPFTTKTRNQFEIVYVYISVCGGIFFYIFIKWIFLCLTFDHEDFWWDSHYYNRIGFFYSPYIMAIPFIIIIYTSIRSLFLCLVLCMNVYFIKSFTRILTVGKRVAYPYIANTLWSLAKLF